jgi:hypothetical protein
LLAIYRPNPTGQGGIGIFFREKRTRTDRAVSPAFGDRLSATVATTGTSDPYGGDFGKCHIGSPKTRFSEHNYTSNIGRSIRIVIITD